MSEDVAMTIDPWISGSGALILLGVAQYFFKKTDKKIDATADAVADLGKRMDERINGLENKMTEENKTVRRDIVEMFQQICHERQDACGRLRDAKLAAVENVCKAQCNKIHGMIDDRNKKWERQEVINDTIKTHMASNHAK